jgi:Cobalamin-independent synthase, Catalytic domain
METQTAVYRAEVIGSMLRPPWLVEARAAMRSGQMDADAYRAVEDRAVDEALRIQEDAGVDVVTDGEMRRDIFFDAFVAGMEGFSHEPAWTVQFHRPDADQAFQVDIPFTVTDRIRARRSPALDEFLAAKDRASKPLKVTIPSPTLVVAFWNNERSRAAYDSPFELFADSANAVREWVRQLFDAGCRYVQIDAPEFNEVYADPRVRAEYVARGVDPDRFKAEGAELLAHVADVPRARTPSSDSTSARGTGHSPTSPSADTRTSVRRCSAAPRASTSSSWSTTTSARARSSPSGTFPTTRWRCSASSPRSGKSWRIPSCCASASRTRRGSTPRSDSLSRPSAASRRRVRPPSNGS